MPDVNTKPRLTSFAPQFLVDDLARSMTYYQKLGFTFGEPWDGFYAIGSRDGLEVHLKEAPKNPAERRAPARAGASRCCSGRRRHRSVLRAVHLEWRDDSRPLTATSGARRTSMLKTRMVTSYRLAAARLATHRKRHRDSSRPGASPRSFAWSWKRAHQNRVRHPPRRVRGGQASGSLILT